MKKSILAISMIVIIGLGSSQISCAQGAAQTLDERETMMMVARQMMLKAHYCALVTIGENGEPHARTMDPFAPEQDLTVWFGTNAHSRKVREIQKDARVTLYYPDPDHKGYVCIIGRTDIIDDQRLKQQFWKEEWSDFYPDRDKGYLLIKVMPLELDVLSYEHNLIGDRKTWRIPHLLFDKK